MRMDSVEKQRPPGVTGPPQGQAPGMYPRPSVLPMPQDGGAYGPSGPQSPIKSRGHLPRLFKALGCSFCLCRSAVFILN